MTLTRRTAEVTRNPPSFRGSELRAGQRRQVATRVACPENSHPASWRCCRRRPCFGAPCWPAPGGGPGECKPAQGNDTPVSFLQRGGPPSRTAAGWGVSLPFRLPSSQSSPLRPRLAPHMDPSSVPTARVLAPPWGASVFSTTPSPSLPPSHAQNPPPGSLRLPSPLSTGTSTSLPLFQVKCWAEKGLLSVTCGVLTARQTPCWAFGVCFVVKT